MGLMKRLVPILALAACAPVEPTVPPPIEDTCNAAAIAPYIGQPVTALEQVELLQAVRVVRPGDIVTMDFLATRLNIGLDENETITQLYCG